MDSGGPYVILSDGCSSSPDTDVGARLLVKAAEKKFTKLGVEDVEWLHKEAARLAIGWAKSIGLPVQATDATLLSAHVSNAGLIVACSGDGVIVLESQSGTIDVYAISYQAGYPYYPSYSHQLERLKDLIFNRRTEKEIKHYRSSPGDQHFTLIDVTTNHSSTEVFELNVSDYKYVAVASDGIDSFFHTPQSAIGKKTENISLLDVLAELWSFKNSHGAFVERRMNRFTKDIQANGWQHADDLSLGVIHLGDENVRHR